MLWCSLKQRNTFAHRAAYSGDCISLVTHPFYPDKRGDKIFMAIPHNSKCRYGERGAADAKPKAQIILDAAKVSAASGGNSEPQQGQRSQSARGFCPRSTMRVPQPDIIEHFGNADAVPQLPERRLSRKAGIVRCCLKTFGACGNTFLPTYWGQAHRVRLPGVTRREPALRPAVLPSAQ